MEKTEIREEFYQVHLREVGQSTIINISLPKNFIADERPTLGSAIKKIQELEPKVKLLANSAFTKKEKKSWDTVQNLLYFWNYRDLTRINRITDYSSFLESALRKIILDIESRTKPKHLLECTANFTPEKAVKEMTAKALSHRINHHPLLEEMAKNGIPKKLIRTFLENYYVNNRVFHLFIAALSLSAPLKRRTEIANNFYDEMGSGDNALAHPVLFLKNFRSLGQPEEIKPLPEALHLMNSKMYTAFLQGDYHYGMGGFGFIELSMPNQMQKILAGLEKSGLPRQDLEFWETHITIDLEHGKTWFAEMLQLIKTPTDALKCLNGGMFLLEARATMYDGILRSL